MGLKCVVSIEVESHTWVEVDLVLDLQEHDLGHLQLDYGRI